MNAAQTVRDADKRQALEQVLRSATFTRARQVRNFLRYICEMELAGRAAALHSADRRGSDGAADGLFHRGGLERPAPRVRCARSSTRSTPPSWPTPTSVSTSRRVHACRGSLSSAAPRRRERTHDQVSLTLCALAVTLSTSATVPSCRRVRSLHRILTTPSAWRGSTRRNAGSSSTGVSTRSRLASGGQADPGHRRVDHVQPPCRFAMRAAREAVQSREVRRERVGAAREGRRDEIHRHHVEAP